jgi:hypothetical protein
MGVREEDIPKRLDAAADELIKLRTENEMLRRGPPELAAIAEEVQALIDKGELDAPPGALARGREAARRLRIDGRWYEAAILAQQARVAGLQFAYRSAAAKFGKAAGLVALRGEAQMIAAWRPCSPAAAGKTFFKKPRGSKLQPIAIFRLRQIPDSYHPTPCRDTFAQIVERTKMFHVKHFGG